MLALNPAETQTENVQQLRDLRNEINQTYRAASRSEALRDAVIRAAREMPPVLVPVGIEHNPIGKRTLVLCIADCHYGAEWTVRGLRGETLNRYSPEVFCERMADLLQQVRAILEKEQIGDVQLLLCGDSLDGIQGESVSEIAQLNHVSIGAVKAVIARFRAKARKIANENFYLFIIYSVSFSTLMRLKK